MTENTVPSFKEIWDSTPKSATPRTLDAAIAFLNQLDGAIDLDDAQLKVYDVLASLIYAAPRARHQSQDFEDRARRQCRGRAHKPKRRSEVTKAK